MRVKMFDFVHIDVDVECARCVGGLTGSLRKSAVQKVARVTISTRKERHNTFLIYLHDCTRIPRKYATNSPFPLQRDAFVLSALIVEMSITIAVIVMSCMRDREASTPPPHGILQSRPQKGLTLIAQFPPA